MALIYENCGKLEKALASWEQLKTEEGCHKTVQILRKKEITHKDLIWKYMPWVLKLRPEVGLQLFIQRKVDHKDKDNKSVSNNSNDLMRSELTISNTLIDDL